MNIELICKNCGISFLKEKKEFTRQTKRGKANFYCGYLCANREINKSKFSPLDRSLNYIILQTRKSAKQKHREWNLSFEMLKKLWAGQKGLCAYTNKPLVFSNRATKSVPESISLDRVDSSKGYVEGNIEFVCLFINLGKNGFSKQQIKDFLK